METTLRFVDNAVPPVRLQGVTVKIYVSGTLFRQGTSNADGELLFDDIPAGDHRVVVGFPMNSGFQINNPYALEVTDEDALFTFPLSRVQDPVGDAVMCCCSGYFFDTFGEPIEDASLRFRPVNAFNVYSDAGFHSGVLMKEVYCKVLDGYAEINLLRGYTYQVDVPWMRVNDWRITVPDDVSANLPLVLFPFVDSVSFDPEAVALDVGETETIDVSVLFTSGLVVSGESAGADWPVSFEVDHPEVVSITRRDDGSLAAVALQAGTARVTCVRADVDQPIQALPDPGVGGHLDITVS